MLNPSSDRTTNGKILFSYINRKEFLAVRAVRLRLPREAVAAPSLEVSKARSDEGWSSLVLLKMTLPMAGG